MMMSSVITARSCATFPVSASWPDTYTHIAVDHWQSCTTWNRTLVPALFLVPLLHTELHASSAWEQNSKSLLANYTAF